MRECTVIHVPHASTAIPPELPDAYAPQKLAHELAVMTDWFCDELFACGREVVRPAVSRLVCDTERFRRLTHLQPKSRQLAILREIFFEEDTPFCPATILEYRRTRDTEEDQTLFPVDWRSSSLERSVRMYSSTRRLVRVHSEPRGQDYYLVFYNTSEGFTLLLAGTAR